MLWMKHPNVEQAAQVAESAVSHWEGLGWQLCDAPEQRRPRHERTAAPIAVVEPAGEPASPPADPPAGDTAPPADPKTDAASAARRTDK